MTFKEGHDLKNNEQINQLYAKRIQNMIKNNMK